MEVATGEFLAYGYEGANMARVARAAQVSPKTVYARYASKDALLLAVVAHLTASSRETIERALGQAATDPARGLTAFALVAAHQWTSEREFGLYRLVVTEAVRFPHLATLFHRSVDAFRATVSAYLADQVAKGALVIDDVPAAVQLLAAVTTGRIREQMLLGERPPPAEVEAMVGEGVAMFLAWCGGPRADDGKGRRP